MWLGRSTIIKVLILASGWVVAALAIWGTEYDPRLWAKAAQLERTLNNQAAEVLFLQNYADRMSHALLSYPRDSVVRSRVNSCLLQVEEDR